MRTIVTNSSDLMKVQEAAQLETRILDQKYVSASRYMMPRKCVDYRAKWGDFVLVDPTSGALNVFLPQATLEDVGKTITVKNYSSSTNTITIRVPADNTIDGVSNIVINAEWQCITACCVGANIMAVLSVGL